METPVFIRVTFIPSLVGLNFWREFPVTSVTFYWNLIHGLKDAVPACKIHGCYQNTQNFQANFYSQPGDYSAQM